MANAIYEYMKSLPNWVLWKIELDKKGRPTKVPYSARYFGRASSTDPATWSTYSEVKAKLEAKDSPYAGIGFVFKEGCGLVFIDVDHCRVNGAWLDIVKDFVPLIECGAYAEISQSDGGLHAITWGTIKRNFKGPQVEMYSCKRFCAITENTIEPEAIADVDASDILAALYDKYKTKTKSRAPRDYATIRSIPEYADTNIIERASNKSSLFRELYAGLIPARYESHSNADIALCMILAFWTDRDPVAIDRIFRTSGLMREKWDRPKGNSALSYCEMTIQEACNALEESITEFIERKRRERDAEYANYILSRSRTV